MHHEFSMGEEEAVWLDFPWSFNDFLLLSWGQLRQIIDEFPWVVTFRNNETELEAIVTDDSTSEIMPFDHFQTFDWLWSYTEIHGQPNCLQLEEVRPQMVFNQPFSRIFVEFLCIILDIHFFLVIRHLNKCDVWNHVSDLESSEPELCPVVA